MQGRTEAAQASTELNRQHENHSDLAQGGADLRRTINAMLNGALPNGKIPMIDDGQARQYQATFLRSIANMIDEGPPKEANKHTMTGLAGAMQEAARRKEFRSVGVPAHLLGTTESYINTLKYLLRTLKPSGGLLMAMGFPAGTHTVATLVTAVLAQQ